MSVGSHASGSDCGRVDVQTCPHVDLASSSARRLETNPIRHSPTRPAPSGRSIVYLWTCRRVRLSASACQLVGMSACPPADVWTRSSARTARGRGSDRSIAPSGRALTHQPSPNAQPMSRIVPPSGQLAYPPGHLRADVTTRGRVHMQTSRPRENRRCRRKGC